MCVHCYKLASDKSRHKILSHLKASPLTVNSLTEKVGVGQPTVTHHLKRLQKVGLVLMEKRGREHLYSLNSENECFTDCGLLVGLK